MAGPDGVTGRDLLSEFSGVPIAHVTAERGYLHSRSRGSVDLSSAATDGPMTRRAPQVATSRSEPISAKRPHVEGKRGHRSLRPRAVARTRGESKAGRSARRPCRRRVDDAPSCDFGETEGAAVGGQETPREIEAGQRTGGPDRLRVPAVANQGRPTDHRRHPTPTVARAPADGELRDRRRPRGRDLQSPFRGYAREQWCVAACLRPGSRADGSLGRAVIRRARSRGRWRQSDRR